MVKFKIRLSSANPGYVKFDIYHDTLDMHLFSRIISEKELQQLREELANVSKSSGTGNRA